VYQSSTFVACRLRPALQSEAPERGAEAAGLLLSLAERLLNAFAAAVPATDPTEPAAVERLVQDYAAARSDILQDALNQAIAFCTQGAPLIVHYSSEKSPQQTPAPAL